MDGISWGLYVATTALLTLALGAVLEAMRK